MIDMRGAPITDALLERIKRERERNAEEWPPVAACECQACEFIAAGPEAQAESWTSALLSLCGATYQVTPEEMNTNQLRRPVKLRPGMMFHSTPREVTAVLTIVEVARGWVTFERVNDGSRFAFRVWSVLTDIRSGELARVKPARAPRSRP